MKNKKSLVLGLVLSLMGASSNAINVTIQNDYPKRIEVYSGNEVIGIIQPGQKFISTTENITAIKEVDATFKHSGIKKELDEIRKLNKNGAQIVEAIITIMEKKKLMSFQYGVQLKQPPTRPTQPAPARQAQSPEAQLLAGNITVAAINEYTEKLSRLDSSVRYPITNHASERLPIAQAIQLLYDTASGEEHQFFINEVKQMAQNYAAQYKAASVAEKQNIELKFKEDVAFSLKIRMSEWNSRK